MVQPAGSVSYRGWPQVNHHPVPRKIISMPGRWRWRFDWSPRWISHGAASNENWLVVLHMFYLFSMFPIVLPNGSNGWLIDLSIFFSVVEPPVKHRKKKWLGWMSSNDRVLLMRVKPTPTGKKHPAPSARRLHGLAVAAAGSEEPLLILDDFPGGSKPMTSLESCRNQDKTDSYFQIVGNCRRIWNPLLHPAFVVFLFIRDVSCCILTMSSTSSFRPVMTHHNQLGHWQRHWDAERHRSLHAGAKPMRHPHHRWTRRV